MTRTGWTSTFFLFLIQASCPAQEEEYISIGEMHIEGTVQEPAVMMIPSRILPEISGFRLEKSFLSQARNPDEQIVTIDAGVAEETRIMDPERLLERPRELKKPPLETDANQQSQQEPGDDGSE